jgi:hypothetical protein
MLPPALEAMKLGGRAWASGRSLPRPARSRRGTSPPRARGGGLRAMPPGHDPADDGVSPGHDGEP